MVDQPAAPQSPYAEITEALPRVACAGETVTVIDIRRYAPSSETAAERAVAVTSDAVGLEHARTQESVIRAYVRLKPGARCTERERLESERLLRAQRFVASAAVTAIPDGEGRVRIRVDVVDELPWVIRASVKDGGISTLRLGTQNLMGRGLTVIASGERGGVYRPGVGVLLAQYGLFGRPAVAAIEVERRPLGGLMQAGIIEPFLTDEQRYAFHTSFEQETDYVRLVRPAGDDAAARTRRSAYDIGLVKRVGMYRRDRLVGLAGLLLMGSDVRTGDEIVVVSDTGMIVTPDTQLDGRYPNFGVGRLAAMGGIRALRFQVVQRFAALRAAQDVGSGVQVNLLVGPSLWKSRSSDVLLAGDLYAGAGDATSFAALRVRAEARRAPEGGPWQGVVGSAQFSWHQVPSDRRTRVMSLSAATVHRLVFPVQLTLRDPDGGLLGFPDSRGAGGQRAVLRVEERMLMPWFRSRADFALAAFADAGRLWAGDVPYGASTPVRSSVGISLLGSYPSGGKRLYRIDFAIPLNPEPGGARFAIRLSAADRTGLFWMEPRDVGRARAGTGPTTLMRW